MSDSTTYCKYCKVIVEIEYCSECDKEIEGACLDCHKETVHDEIVDQNIHICGDQSGNLNSIDKDPDAYKKRAE